MGRTLEEWAELLNSSNTSIPDFLNHIRGPQRPISVFLSLTITIINAVIFATGFIGNITVCYVIFKHSDLKSVTNYYIVNLSIADLLLLLFGLPHDIYLYWQQYPWNFGISVCVARSFVTETATYASVLTIIAFSSERFIAICFPFKLYLISTFSRVKIVICGIWITSLIFAIPSAVFTKIHYVMYPGSTRIIEESAVCGMTEEPKGVPVIEASTLIFFIIPFSCLIYQYIVMEQNLQQVSIINNRRHSMVDANRSVIRMLFAVVMSFFICWLPFHIQRLAVIYIPEYEKINLWLYVTTGIFFYMSSTSNPVLYNLMSKRMRNAFKDILFKNVSRTSSSSTNRSSTTRSSYVYSVVAETCTKKYKLGRLSNLEEST